MQSAPLMAEHHVLRMEVQIAHAPGATQVGDALVQCPHQGVDVMVFRGDHHLAHRRESGPRGPERQPAADHLGQHDRMRQTLHHHHRQSTNLSDGDYLGQ